MSLYDELDNLSLEQLRARFHGRAPHDEEDLYFSEVAHKIAVFGEPGIQVLLNQLSSPDPTRRWAALAALATSAREHPDLSAVFRTHLRDDEPAMVAEAIDGLGLAGDREAEDAVLALRAHPSPYVRASVLRYLRRLFPERAKPLLVEALGDPDCLVRENAADELDELDDPSAVPNLVRLLKDPVADVRQAAITAVEGLERRRRHGRKRTTSRLA
jgi:HEAT repeat protein